LQAFFYGPKEDSVEKPTVSIIIPTYRRPALLKKCLASIAAARLPRARSEVIVIDDGESVSIDGLLKKFDPLFRLTILRQRQAGPSMARNRGAVAAKGEYLVFLDDDCQVPPNWWLQIKSAIRQHPQAIIGGRIVNGLRANPYAATSQALIDFICSGRAHSERPPTFFTSNNLIIPATGFHNIGGFNPRYPFAGDDREVCYRWRRSGGKLAYVPDLMVLHFHHMNLAAFWRQHYRYGRGTLRYHLNRARYESQRYIELESMTFYLNLLIYNCRRPSPIARRIRLALTLISQFATAMGFVTLYLQRLFMQRRNNSQGDPICGSKPQ